MITGINRVLALRELKVQGVRVPHYNRHADLVCFVLRRCGEAGRGLPGPPALASRVQVALATHPETRKYRITVEARAGIVTPEGMAARLPLPLGERAG